MSEDDAGAAEDSPGGTGDSEATPTPGIDIDEDGQVDGGTDADADGDPFADLPDDEDRDPFEDDLFSEEAVGEMDEDAVWEQLERREDGAAEVGSEAGGAPGGRETIVEKRSYCERCEYLSEPPEVACTHPGTEIVELVDTGRFRVRNCPVVARRESPDVERIAGGDEPELGADGSDGE